MVNKVMLVGNLGRDPEMRALPSGQQVANFSLATSRRYKDRDGNRKDETEWHNIVVFGKQAEIAGQYLTKGKMVFVEGRIQTRSWDDKESGKKQYKTEIICENFQMLGSKGDGSGGGSRDAGGSAPAGGVNDPGHEFPDDDIPF
ncbi:MAG: single-strand DNA-binding protein [Acidobacteriota bacterium]|nr:single-strand DNA-binding protein [Acidobacteriota bacterium]